MNTSGESSVKLSKPFSSDTAEDKEDLLKEADLYRDKLERQWGSLKGNASEYGKQALIIGGVVTTTFLVLNALLPKENKKAARQEEAEKPSIKGEVYKKRSSFAVGDAVQSLAWTLAVGWARKKLQNYIADDQEPDENSPS
jgi:hypothetical protein